MFIITLFEIPIYEMDKGTYDRKWDQKEDREFQKISLIKDDGTFDEAIVQENENNIKNCIRKKKLDWHYNKIIGFIIIQYDVTIGNIIFDYVIEDGHPRFDSAKRKPMKYQNLNGVHFRVNKTDSNETIVENISREITELQSGLLKNRYIDTTVFDQLKGAIDFRKLCRFEV